VARALGRDPAAFVVLSSNENPFGPSPEAVAALRERAGRVNAYPKAAHTDLTAAIAERSRVFSDPIGRFHRTFGIIFVLVFGTLDQAFAAARRLHQLHGAIDVRLGQRRAAVVADPQPATE
jgi:histidinol-phosphate aminotransferase